MSQGIRLLVFYMSFLLFCVCAAIRNDDSVIYKRLFSVLIILIGISYLYYGLVVYLFDPPDQFFLHASVVFGIVASSLLVIFGDVAFDVFGKAVDVALSFFGLFGLWWILASSADMGTMPEKAVGLLEPYGAFLVMPFFVIKFVCSLKKVRF